MPTPLAPTLAALVRTAYASNSAYPQPLRPDEVLALQRHAGNASVARWMLRQRSAPANTLDADAAVAGSRANSVRVAAHAPVERRSLEDARRYALAHEKPDDHYKLEFLTRGEGMPNDPYPFGGPGSPDDVLWHDFVVSKYGPDCTDNMGRVLEGLPVVENERIWRIYHETGRHHDKTDQ